MTRKEDSQAAAKKFDPSTAKVFIGEHELAPSMTDAEASLESPKKRETSTATRAAQAVNKIAKINAEEALELAASPEAIRAKHAARRAAVLAAVGEDVAALAGKMLAP